MDRNPECSNSVIFNGARLIAVGDNGLVARITVVADSGNEDFGIDVLNSPSGISGPDLTTCWGDVVQECTSGGDYIARLIVGGKDEALFTTLSGGYDAQVEWQDITSDSLSITLKDIEIDISGDRLYPRLRGGFLTHWAHFIPFTTPVEDPIAV